MSTRPPSPDFEELPEHHLQGLSDDGLVDYLRRAREAGRTEAMNAALAVLVYGYWQALVGRARLRLPEEDAEDVAAEAVASAIASAFDGRSTGEFRSWLHTILSRRIADYHEARKRRPKTSELPSEHQGSDDVWGDEPYVEFEGEALFAQACVRSAMDEIEDDRHREVVRLYVFGPCSAARAAELAGHGMTEGNVHQISSRFQKRVRELLEEGGDTSS